MRYKDILEFDQSANAPTPELASINLKSAIMIIATHLQHNDLDQIKINQLLSWLPRPKQGLTLYRVVEVSQQQMAALQSGQPIYEDRRSNFSFWTKDIKAVPKIANEIKSRADTWNAGAQLVVTMHNFAAENIVVDVDAFYEEHYEEIVKISSKFSAVFMMMNYEKEVIVSSKPQPMTNKNTKPVDQTLIQKIKSFFNR